MILRIFVGDLEEQKGVLLHEVKLTSEQRKSMATQIILDQDLHLIVPANTKPGDESEEVCFEPRHS